MLWREIICEEKYVHHARPVCSARSPLQTETTAAFDKLDNKTLILQRTAESRVPGCPLDAYIAVVHTPGCFMAIR
jgi:hypothetical protein